MQIVSWAEANTSDRHPAEFLSHRISDLEQTINTQLSEIRTEVTLAAAAMRASASASQLGGISPLGDLEDQLARAVTISLSAALETIRESLTEAVANAVSRLAASLDGRPTDASGPVVRTQLSAADLDEITASLQHSVVLALSSFEPSGTRAPIESNEALATVSDVARVNQRIDELRSLLLG